MKVQSQIKLSAYHGTDGFIHNYQKLVKEVVIPYQYDILNDKVEGAEKSHVVANFVNAAKVLRGEDPGDGFYGMVFQDSDAAKWLEAVAYALVNFPDKDLEQKADELIDLIAAAQDSNGYLNTYFTIKDQEKRWKNLLEGHELYCAGHMMEAAVAYYEATGKKTLLDVMEKNAEHIYQHFVVEKAEGYPGHPEVELALLRLYSATGNKHCLEVAEHFINVRGVDPYYYEKEVKSRDWQVWGNDATNHDYQQSGKPVREQVDATGHSVRAVYLFTAMTDLASRTEDKELMAACRKLWESITQRRMYVTGGIGSTVEGEAFSVDYDLPNDTAYAETCASIGLMFFAGQMLENDVDSEYADVMERAFYNTVLAGMQLDGKKFFYVNPLEVVPGISEVTFTRRHVKVVRPKWYTCACCPPNAARLISSFAKYAYGENAETVFCHLVADGEVQFENGMELACESGNFPYTFDVTYTVKKGGKNLAIRIPYWSEKTEILLNGEKVDYELSKGYAYLKALHTGDVVSVKLDDRVKMVYNSDLVPANTGAVAIQRGPLIYCVEGADNAGKVMNLFVNDESEVKEGQYEELVEGNPISACTKLELKGMATHNNASLYSFEKPEKAACTITAIPYYTWGNRGENEMRVWLPTV